MRTVFFRCRLQLLAVMVACTAVPVFATSPRVLPEGRKPADRRLGELRSLNNYFPFSPPETEQQWESRSEAVRRRMLVALGLWPMPSPTPARAVVHGKVEREGYTVEKVYFESLPGHFVTGNLYRPAQYSGRLPAILSPHGHWANGRFHEDSEKTVRQRIVEGAERFEVGGRHPLQARCVELARMGCMVFHYDMEGYADSIQLSHAPRRRDALSTAENWGFASPQAELRLQNHMGLQTYNTIRALDWLLTLPDVDPARIGVTGASGGGTQTFILCALDSRPAVSFPAVMVSTAMQGGCACENACYLRIGTGNIEFAALFAPKPLGMVAADDWTREIEQKGMPELRHPMFAQRVHDVLTTIAFARGESFGAKRVMLLGTNGAGRWVAGACAQAGQAIHKAAVDTAGFRFEPLTEFDHADFLAGAVKYGDLPGLISLAAPVPLWLAGEGDTPPATITATYAATGDHGRVETFTGPDPEQAAAAWLLR